MTQLYQGGFAKIGASPIKRIVTRIAVLALTLAMMASAAAAIADPCPAGDAANIQGQSTVTIDQESEWRPRGGDVKFAIDGPDLPAGLQPTVCIRWAKDKSSGWIASPVRLVRDATGKSGYTAAVPLNLPVADGSLWGRLIRHTQNGVATALGLVPLADFRVIAKTSSGATVLDVTEQIGVTNQALAYAVTLLIVIIAWSALYMFGRVRQVPGHGDAVLQIISTRNGYASLSQLQIILWSFVVGASTVYVMALSGNLVELSQGTLVLLGISGVSTLGSKLQSSASPSNAALPMTPGPVVGLHADEPAGETDVRLTWAAPVTRGQPDSYVVQYQPTDVPAADWVAATDTLSRPGFRVVGLTADTPYAFRVCGVNAGGPGDWTQITLRTETEPQGVVGPVTGLRPTDKVTNTSIAVVWAGVGGAPQYEVEYRRHDSDEGWTRVIAQGLSARIERLAARTLYDIRVAAAQANTQSLFGRWQTLTLSTTGPRVPRWSDLVVDSDGANEINVTRVQMLLFTVIVAFFVMLRVLATGAIPNVPNTFLLLMGISNSVYLGAKFIPGQSA